jgi:hypothetical protein
MAFDFPNSPTSGDTFTPTGGPTYIFQNGAWLIAPIRLGYADIPADAQLAPITAAIIGQPGADVSIYIPIVMGVTIDPALGGARAYCNVLPTANAIFTINKVTAAGIVTELGTITFVTTSNTGVALAGAGGSLVPGDTLQILAPAQDATLADIGITLFAKRV